MNAAAEHPEAGPKAEAEQQGLAQAQDGYPLSPVSAPSTVGTPVDDHVRSHEQDLHLVVVRSDGAGFRHVHPGADASSTLEAPTAGRYPLRLDLQVEGRVRTAGLALDATAPRT